MRKTFTLMLVIALSLASIAPSSGVQTKKCSKTPAMTEGPYYLPDMPIRSDITEGFPGIPTKLTLTVLDKNCRAVPNAQVDVWHTNASGEYSGVEGNPATYMRGSQITGKNGKVIFVTVFPGWYPSRTMHIHAKVWVNGEQALTTQFYTDDRISSKIYAMAPYKARGQQGVNNSRDRIYQSLGKSSRLLTLKAQVAPKNITLTGSFILS